MDKGNKGHSLDAFYGLNTTFPYIAHNGKLSTIQQCWEVRFSNCHMC